MIGWRFPLALGVALMFGAAEAHAQSTPAAQPAKASVAATMAQTRVIDIEVAQSGDVVSILVKLSDQPSAASAAANGDQLTIEIDGVDLATLNLSPPAGSLMSRVSAAKSEIVMRGVALSAPDVIVYRRAVMVTAKMAEPADIHGESLLTGASPAAQPSPMASKPAAAAPVTPPPVVAKPEAPAIAPTPVSAANTLEPAKHDHASQSAPAVAAVGPAATLAGIDAARCKAADEELANDSWALGAMGDHALCLIDAGETDEATAKLDQLGAITPHDWRVSLGRALLAEDAATANALFVGASLAAPNDQIRASIAGRIKPDVIAAPAAEPELQLPLPK